MPILKWCERLSASESSPVGAAFARDTQADAHADKCGACNGGGKRHLRDLRPERREALENGIEQRKAAACDDGIEDKLLAQKR